MSKNSNLSRLAHIVTANSSNSVTLSGNVTASHFIGDGSQLTNLTVPGAGGGSAVVNGHITGNTLVLIKSNDISINLDLDDFANRIIDAAGGGGGGGNPTTSVAMSGNTMLFTRDDASTYSVDLDDFANRIIDVNAALIPTLPANTSTTSAAMSGNTMLFTRDDASTFSVDLDNFANRIIDVNATLIAALPANPANTSTATAAMSGNTMLFTRQDASNFSVDLDDFADNILDAVPANPANTSTSTAAMSGNTMLFTRQDASNFSVDLDDFANRIVDAVPSSSLPTTISIENTTGVANAGGANSIAFGYGAESKGGHGIAIGTFANSNSPNAISLGAFSQAMSDSHIALGHGAQTNGSSSAYGAIAIGKDAHANNGSQSGAIAIGHDAMANMQGIAIGYAANTGTKNQPRGVSIGMQAHGNGSVNQFVALGYSASSKGSGVAVGFQARANTNSVSIGKSASGNDGAVSVGTEAYAGPAGVSIGQFARQHTNYSTNTVLIGGYASVDMPDHDGSTLTPDNTIIGAYANCYGGTQSLILGANSMIAPFSYLDGETYGEMGDSANTESEANIAFAGAIGNDIRTHKPYVIILGGPQQNVEISNSLSVLHDIDAVNTISANNFVGDGSLLTGIPGGGANTSTTSATMSGNTMLFTRDDASTFSVDLDDFADRILDAVPATPANTSTSTAAMSGNTMLFTRDDASTFSVDLDDFANRILDASGGGGGNPTTSAAMSGNTMLFTRDDASTFSVDLDDFANRIIDASGGGGGGGGASELDDLSDVTISGVADGDLLRYNGTSNVFENTNLGVTVTPIINCVSEATNGGPLTFHDTQYEFHTDPDYHVQLVDAANTADIKVADGSVTRVDENGNFSLTLPADGGGGNYTIQMRAQNFGSLASETATANVETTSIFGFTARYVKFQNWVGLVSADVSVNSMRLYTGGQGTGTTLPSSAMTSASAPSPFVITSSDTGYGSYSFWKAFGGNYDAFWTLSTSSTNDNLWLKIDLGASYTINSVRVGGSYLQHKPTGFTVAYSTDDVSYTLSDTVTFDIQSAYYSGSVLIG